VADQPLNVGDPAPDFALQDTNGDTVSLASLAGKPFVLFFYPRDNTPGCTTEACSFRDDYSRFVEVGIAVLGASTDNIRSHQKFTEKFSLPFPLLADVEGNLAKAFGIWGEKKFMGRTSMGVKRSTFVVDGEAKISHVFTKVKPDTHVAEVLKALGRV
jgi:thioredoxin-dependent peroxiredoxin